MNVKKIYWLLTVWLFEKPNHEDIGQQSDQFALHILFLTC